MNLPAKRPSKRQHRRDQRVERAARRLRQNPLFARLPVHLVRGYAQLTILSAEVRAKLSERGLVDSEGVWSPGIDVFRRLKDSEAKYLSLMLDVSGKDQRTPKPVLDLDDIRDDEKAPN
jgi:hypothetical protein